MIFYGFFLAFLMVAPGFLILASTLLGSFVGIIFAAPRRVLAWIGCDPLAISIGIPVATIGIALASVVLPNLFPDSGIFAVKLSSEHATFLANLPRITLWAGLIGLFASPLIATRLLTSDNHDNQK